MPKIEIKNKPAHLNLIEEEHWKAGDLEEKVRIADRLYDETFKTNDVNARQQLLTVRKELYTAVLAEQMSDKEYEAFQQRLQSNEKTQQLLDKMAENVTASAILHKDFQEAFITGLLGAQKENIKNRHMFKEEDAFNYAMSRADYRYNREVQIPQLFKDSSTDPSPWLNSDLSIKIRRTDQYMITINENNMDRYPDLMDVRKKLFQLYLGKDLNKEQYAQFVNDVSQDPKKREAFEDLTRSLDVNNLEKHKETLQTAFFGHVIGKSQEEIAAANEKTKKISADGANRTLVRNKIDRYLTTVLEQEKQEIKEAQMVLKHTVPNPANEGLINLQSYELDKDKTKYYEAAAVLVGSGLYLSVKPENSDYDVERVFDNVKVRKEQIKMLAQDEDFHDFVLEELSKKNADRLEPDAMRSNFRQYMDAIENSTKNYKEDIKSFREEGVIPEREGLRFFDKPKNNDLEVIDDDEYKYMTKDEAKAAAQAVIDASVKDKNAAFGKKDFVQAANLIVAHSLLSKSGEMTFFENKDLQYNGSMKVEKMNQTIMELRDQVISDPVFSSLLSRRVKQSELVSKYRKALSREVNNKIKKQADKEVSYKGNFSKEAMHKKYAGEHTVELEDKEISFIKDTYENIKKFNEGKKPSPLMEELTKSLKNVVDAVENGQKSVTIDKMEALNKANLNYYKERQGVVFSPITSKGKARLGAVEKLALLTDKVVDRAVAQEKQEMRQRQAAVPRK